MGTQLIGIVNVTPDSFCDGGRNFSPHHALDHIDRLLHDGADWVDIGAESTRPGATTLTWEEEWQRLEPVLRHLTREQHIHTSIDSYHPETAQRALDLGVGMINDVSAGADPAMLTCLKHYPDCQYVFMHNLGIPANKRQIMTQSPQQAIHTIYRWAEEKIEQFQAQGLQTSQLIFDPGIGFGKNAEQSFAIVNTIARFTALPIPLLIGHSQKSFLQLLTNKPAGSRQLETLMISHHLFLEHVAYLRVHDVASHRHISKLL